MLPQHGGVPNFNLRISGPFILLLALVLVTGLLLTLSFHLNADPGDLAAQNRATLSLLSLYCSPSSFYWLEQAAGGTRTYGDTATVSGSTATGADSIIAGVNPVREESSTPGFRRVSATARVTSCRIYP